MTQPITTYLKQVVQRLATGDATEHTHRSALETLLEALDDVQAINEPKRSDCGAPDFAVLRDSLLVGHIEAKDIGKNLDAIERSDQLLRYREALNNLILTDYLEFRWYVGGELRRTARLAQQGLHGALKKSKASADEVRELLASSDAAHRRVRGLLTDFLAHTPEPIGTPRKLAERMARLAHLIREIIVTAFERGEASETLKGWRQAFAEVLIAELDEPENMSQFADMFAQTLAYGLFSARVMALASPQPPTAQGGRGEAGETPVFSRQTAQRLIPKTNPFLRKFFYEITGPDLDDEPYAGLVNDLVQVLAHADMDAILEDFGRHTRQDDPTVHFYETFLAAYDPALRERRGVYYTPTPVVSFIVRSVDALLKSKFALLNGLADTRTIQPPSLPPHVEGSLPKVLLLDPATGTGTFLYAVIDHIREHFMQQGNAGMWSGFVREHLLPRLFGFELLMAPYAVAHFKLAFQLAGHDLAPAQREQWAYDFASDERLGVYLTNALEAIEEEIEGLWGPLRIVTEEAQQANKVKRDYPIMVVIGNPPYSVSSSNKGDHIEDLMDRYKTAVRSERNIQPLSDDYIKFIRFAHDRIERTGHGVIGFITNHSYLSGLIHRGMREELLKTFDEIYILNLHGNALMGETAPDGDKDENVFDIRQGVAIALMVKTGKGEGLAAVHHADLWGEREDKYRVLNENDVETLDWEILEPITPYFFFVPKDFSLLSEYEQGWHINAVLPMHSSGIKTHRDDFVIDFDRETLCNRIALFRQSTYTDAEVRERFDLQNNGTWSLSEARRNLQARYDWKEAVEPILYRPFDLRVICYLGDLIDRPRQDVMRHMQYDNLALLTMRQVVGDPFRHVLVTDTLNDMNVLTSHHVSQVTFPLYLYPNGDFSLLLDSADLSPWSHDPDHGNRVPNLAPAFVAEMEEKLGLTFEPHKPPSVPPHVGGSKPHHLPRSSAMSTPSSSPSNGEEEGAGGWRRGPIRAAPHLYAELKAKAKEMRKHPTPAEDALWQQLRKRQVAGVKFRRQHIIDRFIVDFYAAEPGLVIEVDGPIHQSTREEDALRQGSLESLGLRVLRFTNEQVLHNITAVIAAITTALEEEPHKPHHLPHPSATDSPSSQLPSTSEGIAGGREKPHHLPRPSATDSPSSSPSDGEEEGVGRWRRGSFGPRDLLAYIYALFHSPTYRERYAEFLKIDFPRVPITSDADLFWQLVTLGQELIDLHLMRHPKLAQSITSYPINGSDRVKRRGGFPKFIPAGQSRTKTSEVAERNRVYLNLEQYFVGVPEEVWEFEVGGYQVLHKWLKDRKGRKLSYSEIEHYQKIIVALQETIRLMEEIDAVIPSWPIK